jgi:spore maturation protein CgeB
VKILHVQWSVLGTADIEEAFLAEGYDVVRFPFSKNQDVVHNQKVEEELTTALHKEVPDVVFSFDFFPVISKICTKEGIQYISWIFDDPCVFLYSDTVTNACNRIYVFDKELCQQFQNEGIRTINYMPLAANTKRLDTIESKIDSGYAYDVAFVGSLYIEQLNFFDQMYDALPEYSKGYLHALMAIQMQIQNYDLIESSLSPIIKDLYRSYPFGIEPGNRATREYLYAQFVINRRITSIERIDLLDAVSKIHKVDLFTHFQGFAMPNICNHGPVEYQEGAPEVFKRSRINLNITLRSIKNGIPLRVFDIMGAGGFLLSNFQSGFLDIFIPDEDFVYYENKRDLVRKVSYYLKHEDERKAIARNGHDKTAAGHTYRHRVREMFDQ